MQIHSVDLHRAAYRPEDFPRDQRPQFAIVGRSNVGKSTLINALLKRKSIARVSQTPGKTQAIHFYLINERFYLVDLPGYGYAKVSQSVRAQWGRLVTRYFETAEDLKLLFLLLDSRRVPSGEDHMMLELARSSAVGIELVLTKADKLSRNELIRSQKVVADDMGVEKEKVIPFSKLTRQGVEELWRPIIGWLEQKPAP